MRMSTEIFAEETEALRNDDLTSTQRNSWALENEIYREVIRQIVREKFGEEPEG